MKILITSLQDFEKITITRLHQLVRCLSENHDITILCTNFASLREEARVDPSKMYRRDEYFKPMFQKVKIVYLAGGRVPPFLQQILIKTIDNRLKEIDLDSFDVHLNYQSLIPGYLVAKKAQRLGIPTIFDLADDVLKRYSETESVPYVARSALSLIAPWLMKRNMEIAERVTFVTYALKDFYAVPQHKSRFLPNGVNTELFRNHPPHQLRERLGIERDFIVGWVGALHKWVDFEPIFRAIRQLDEQYPNIKVLIVAGQGNFKENEELSQKYGISDKVITLKRIPHSQVPDYISCMDVCLVPLRTERSCQLASPMKMFEYMACEKPVISVWLKGTAEMVRDKVFYASNVEEYKDRITELYNNQQLRREVGLRGRRFVEENYSWSAIAAELEKVLAEAVSSSQRNRQERR